MSMSLDWSRRARRSSRRAIMAVGRDFRPAVERLENYQLLSVTYTVKNTLDSGPDSLRFAINSADAAGVAATIVFNIPGTGPQTIQLLSDLQTIKVPMVIDGWSEGVFQGTANYTGPPLVEIKGGLGLNGIDLNVGSAGSTVQGLSLVGFKFNATTNSGGTAIIIEPPTTSPINSGNDLIRGNYIGVMPDGTTVAGNDNAGVSIFTSGNTVGGTAASDANLISGNGQAGVWVSGVPFLSLFASNILYAANSGTSSNV